MRRKEIMEDMVPFLTDATIESCTRELERSFAEADQHGLTLLANEHIVNVLKEDVLFSLHRGNSFDPVLLGGNGTLIPDRLLARTQPIILIRHPVLQIRSVFQILRTMMKLGPRDEDLQCLVSLVPSRAVFELFRGKGVEPIVLDGEDLIWRTRPVTEGLCARLGLDPDKFSETWETWPEDKTSAHPMIKGFLHTIYTSTGIQRPEKKVRRRNVCDC
jgi:hypothetical protein